MRPFLIRAKARSAFTSSATRPWACGFNQLALTTWLQPLGFNHSTAHILHAPKACHAYANSVSNETLATANARLCTNEFTHKPFYKSNLRQHRACCAHSSTNVFAIHCPREASRRIRPTHAPYSRMARKRAARDGMRPTSVPKAVSARHFQYAPRNLKFDNTASRANCHNASIVCFIDSPTRHPCVCLKACAPSS